LLQDQQYSRRHTRLSKKYLIGVIKLHASTPVSTKRLFCKIPELKKIIAVLSATMETNLIRQMQPNPGLSLLLIILRIP